MHDGLLQVRGLIDLDLLDAERKKQIEPPAHRKATEQARNNAAAKEFYLNPKDYPQVVPSVEEHLLSKGYTKGAVSEHLLDMAKHQEEKDKPGPDLTYFSEWENTTGLHYSGPEDFLRATEGFETFAVQTLPAGVFTPDPRTPGQTYVVDTIAGLHMTPYKPGDTVFVHSSRWWYKYQKDRTWLPIEQVPLGTMPRLTDEQIASLDAQARKKLIFQSMQSDPFLAHHVSDCACSSCEARRVPAKLLEALEKFQLQEQYELAEVTAIPKRLFKA